MNFTGLITAFLICTIPVLAALACMVVLIKEFKLGFGFVAVFCGLFAVVPIYAIQFFMETSGLINLHSLFSVLIKSILVNGVVFYFSFKENVNESFFCLRRFERTFAWLL